MIDIAWSEFLFIALLALILIGPKELPFVLRNIGRWVGKARAFAKDLSTQLDLHTHLEDDLEQPPKQTPSHKLSHDKKTTSLDLPEDPKS